MVSTAARVPSHTDPAVNRRIAHETAGRVAYFATRPEKISAWLDELDREWDIERAIELNASTLALAGMALGLAVDRRWYVLPALVSGFLLQHAMQGWCPPVPVLRRLGFRTADEINQERYALKVVRGDFRQVEKMS